MYVFFFLFNQRCNIFCGIKKVAFRNFVHYCFPFSKEQQEVIHGPCKLLEQYDKKNSSKLIPCIWDFLILHEEKKEKEKTDRFCSLNLIHFLTLEAARHHMKFQGSNKIQFELDYSSGAGLPWQHDSPKHLQNNTAPHKLSSQLYDFRLIPRRPGPAAPFFRRKRARPVLLAPKGEARAHSACHRGPSSCPFCRSRELLFTLSFLAASRGSLTDLSRPLWQMDTRYGRGIFCKSILFFWTAESLVGIHLHPEVLIEARECKI